MSDYIPDKLVMRLTYYYELVMRHRSTFLWANGMYGLALSEAQEREILDVVCEQLRSICRLTDDDEHRFFKNFAITAYFGSKKKYWTISKGKGKPSAS
jgi:hypothetical protein